MPLKMHCRLDKRCQQWEAFRALLFKPGKGGRATGLWAASAAVIKRVTRCPPSGQCGVGLCRAQGLCVKDTKLDCSNPCEAILLCPWMMMVVIIFNQFSRADYIIEKITKLKLRIYRFSHQLLTMNL